MGIFDDLIPAGAQSDGPLRITVRPGGSVPRGIRNNNAGNIEDGPFARSQPGYSGSDGRFARFDSPDAGLGAIDGLLQSYAKRGIDTPAGVVNRWAPSSDGNPVSSYAGFVAQPFGGDPNARLDMNDPAVRRALAERIAQFENGQPVKRSQPQQASISFDDLIPIAGASPQGAPEAAVNGRSLRAAQDMPEPTGAEAFGRATAQGLTANFYDEIRGLMEAGGLNPNDPASLSALFKGAMRLLQSDPEASAAYEGAAGRERTRDDLTEAQRPGTSIAGNLAGAIASPLGMVGRGAQAAAALPGRIAQGIRQGAIYGGVAGAGEGEGATGTATGAATGAVLGGALGGALPVAMRGVEAAGRGIVQAASPVTNTIRAVRNPEGEAARRVTESIRKDYKAGQPGLSGVEYRAARAEGQPVAVMDLGGETTRAMARSAANTSPEGRGQLTATIGDRFEGQAGRVADWLNRTFNYPNAEAQQQALQQVAKTVNAPAYARAYRDGAAGVWDSELQAISQAPAVQDAVKAAIRQAQNRSAPQANNPNLSRRWVSQDGKPTLEFWDLVKRQVDQEINVAKRAGRNEDVAELTGIKQTIVGKLDTAVPSYSAARAGAAKAFGAEDALDAGQKFVSSKMTGREARQALAKMSPQERQLFQDGFVSKFMDDMGRIGDRRDVLNKIANTPAAREKLEIALGPQKSKEMEALLRVEGVMDLARRAVQGNSTTARQLVELGLAGGVGGYGYMTSDPSAIMNAALTWGLARGHRGIDARVSRKVADMLTSSDPRVLAKGHQIVSRQGRFLDQLRKFDEAFARAGAGQSENLPVLQGAGIGRADSEQQQVPRPPGQ